ncbi:MAG: hypothetical protein JNK04_21465 [Myxococcales bacterium]|nr:hypothetical protein [Myxococcales bacterium]
MARSKGQYRYQLRALTSLARYVPVYIGLMLATSFTLSVLYDGSDTGSAAYRAGADLLGLYGGFGAVVLPFLLLVTARLRRGRPEPILSSKVTAGALELVVRGRRRDRKLAIANRRVKSAYAYQPIPGRTTLSLELEGGPTDGDRIELDLPTPDAAAAVARFTSRAQQIDLSRSGYTSGVVVWSLAVMLGAIVTSRLLEHMHAIVARFPHGVPAGVSSSDWFIGLAVTATGLFGAIGNLLLSPTTMVVGVDGVRVQSFFRKRFVSYASLIRLERWAFGLRVVTRDGSFRIWCPSVDDARFEHLFALVDDNIHAARRAPVLPQLAPGPLADAVRRWRESILGRVDVASYRVPTITPEDLTGTLSSPAVPPEGRIAAALALTARGESDARENIRIAAEHLADERTRAILEDLADEEADEARLDIRLARLSSK